MIDWLQSILDWYMHNVNYWSVLVCMTIESSIIPFPAELIVPPAAWKAANGDLNFLLVVIFSTIGSVLGALFNYVLAYTLGRKFIYSFAESRWGKILRMSKEKVEKLLKQSFRPEFLNRLDEIVFYKPLTQNETAKILDLLIADLNKRLETQEITIELTDNAKEYLIKNGYDPVYGARPLKRFVQKKVETLIAKEIIKQTILPKQKVIIDCKENDLIIK